MSSQPCLLLLFSTTPMNDAPVFNFVVMLLVADCKRFVVLNPAYQNLWPSWFFDFTLDTCGMSFLWFWFLICSNLLWITHFKLKEELHLEEQTEKPFNFIHGWFKISKAVALFLGSLWSIQRTRSMHSGDSFYHGKDLKSNCLEQMAFIVSPFVFPKNGKTPIMASI